MNRLVSAALAGAATIAVYAVFVAARQPADHEALPVPIAEPERSAPAPAAAAAPPTVPPAADAAPPVSFTLVTTWRDASGRTRTVEQQVTRGHDHVNLVVDDGRREWAFERNPVHRDRVSGWLIDHDAKEIRVYQESDLRTALRLRGWLDVLTMRVDLSALDALQGTGERRDAAGVTFTRLRPADAPDTGIVDVWWSPELLLPLELVTRESSTLTTTARVIGLSRQVEQAALLPPGRRFPTYTVLDEVDAGEHR